MLREFRTMSAMRIFSITGFLTLVFLTGSARALPGSGDPCIIGDQHCIPGVQKSSRHDLTAAHNDYDHAKKFMKEGRLPDAADALDKALKLAPEIAEYVTAREMVRQQMVRSEERRVGKE